MYQVEAENFQTWRNVTRKLLQRNIAPDTLCWNETLQSSLALDAGRHVFDEEIAIHELNIPKAFIGLAKNVACFRDERRWALLYKVAWRLVFQDRECLTNRADRDISRLRTMEKQVSRDKHKMKAFLRFKRVATSEDSEEVFVAWFEPEHLILEDLSDFFIKRFNNMSWSILTPDICAHWDQKEIKFTQGSIRPNGLNDELDELWRQYYASIFNPARLKLKAMQAEMPKKYWAHLPEAELISNLTRHSSSQVETMIHKQAKSKWQKTRKSKFVQCKQKELRAPEHPGNRKR